MVQGQKVQTLRGKIVDAVTNEPLTGATVRIGNTSVGTTTDAQGRFRLEIESEVKSKLQFSFIGYETQEIEIDPDSKQKQLNIKLFPEAQDLKQIGRASCRERV